jgi:hypothetical protein
VIDFRKFDVRILAPAGAIFKQTGHVLLPEIFLPLAACCERELELRQAQSTQSVQWELPPIDRESLQVAIAAIRSVISEYDRRYVQPSDEAEAWDALRKLLAQLLGAMESFYFKWGNA